MDPSWEINLSNPTVKREQTGNSSEKCTDQGEFQDHLEDRVAHLLGDLMEGGHCCAALFIKTIPGDVSDVSVSVRTTWDEEIIGNPLHKIRIIPAL
jgi:hypothetical protein